MLVHAVHFLITKIQELAFEGHRRKRERTQMCLCSTAEFVAHQKMHSSQRRPDQKDRTHTCVSYITTCMHACIHTHAVHTDTISLLPSGLPCSSWAWRFPWRCSTTSTERGRSTMLSLAGGTPVEKSPAAWWDKTPVISPTLSLYNLFRASFAPLPSPEVLYSFQLCPRSALLAPPPLFTIHFAKE